MLKGKTKKLEIYAEVRMFVGKLKGTRGGLFYIFHEKKIFVSTNGTSHETNYMTNYKPHNIVILEELLFD